MKKLLAFCILLMLGCAKKDNAPSSGGIPNKTVQIDGNYTNTGSSSTCCAYCNCLNNLQSRLSVGGDNITISHNGGTYYVAGMYSGYIKTSLSGSLSNNMLTLPAQDAGQPNWYFNGGTLNFNNMTFSASISDGCTSYNGCSYTASGTFSRR